MLAPLAPDWDKLDAQRKAKWRGIAQRYPRMSPDEQQRVQQQMRPWAQLTPQQRAGRARAVQEPAPAAAREEGEVRQRWEQYQNLPPEQRRELADKGTARRAARIPAPAHEAAARASAGPDADMAQSPLAGIARRFAALALRGAAARRARVHRELPAGAAGLAWTRRERHADRADAGRSHRLVRGAVRPWRGVSSGGAGAKGGARCR